MTLGKSPSLSGWSLGENKQLPTLPHKDRTRDSFYLGAGGRVKKLSCRKSMHTSCWPPSGLEPLTLRPFAWPSPSGWHTGRPGGRVVVAGPRGPWCREPVVAVFCLGQECAGTPALPPGRPTQSPGGRRLSFSEKSLDQWAQRTNAGHQVLEASPGGRTPDGSTRGGWGSSEATSNLAGRSGPELRSETSSSVDISPGPVV